MTFPSANSLDCKGYWIFSPVFGPLETSKLKVARHRDNKPGVHCCLILQDSGASAKLSVLEQCTLGKVQKVLRSRGVVLCHRAVCCRLSPSWNSTVDDWRWQTKQEALSLVSAKDTNPEAVVSECWGVLMGGSCPVLVSEVCDAGAVWMYCAVKRRRQWLLRKRLWMVHSIFPCVIVFSVHSWIIKKVTVSETSPKCQLVIFLPISFPESYALFLLTSALFDKKKKNPIFSIF